MEHNLIEVVTLNIYGNFTNDIKHETEWMISRERRNAGVSLELSVPISGSMFSIVFVYF